MSGSVKFIVRACARSLDNDRLNTWLFMSFHRMGLGQAPETIRPFDVPVPLGMDADSFMELPRVFAKAIAGRQGVEVCAAPVEDGAAKFVRLSFKAQEEDKENV